MIKASALLVLSVAVISCNPIKYIQKKLDEIQVVAKPEVLEVHGGQIEYSLKGKIPAKVFHKKAYITLTPVVKYAGKSKDLESLVLRGEKTEGSGRVISFDNGGSIELSGDFAYDEGMEGEEVQIDLKIKVCKNPDVCQEFTKEKLAVGVINTSNSVKHTEETFTSGNTDPISRKFKRSIFFLINSWSIRSSERKGDAMNELWDFVKMERLELKGININSFASPDGELRLNQNLTKKRSDATYKLLTRELKRLKIDVNAGESLYKKESLEEDWNGLKKLVSASSIADKSAALQIINSSKSVDDKETALKALNSWEVILSDMMPKLRRSDMVLNGTIKNRTLAELKELAKTSIDGFNTKELLIYANGAESDAEHVRALEAFVKANPKSTTGYNNLAAHYIAKDDIAAATKWLDAGKTATGDNDSLYCNFGVISAKNGDLDEAMTSYARAEKAGISVGSNKAIINIIKGNYDDAMANMPSANNDYNAALLQLLKGNYDECINKINNSKKIDADMHYLAAIANARKGSVDAMAASLRQAVKANSKLADKAATDLEFLSFRDRTEFKNAINQ